jgi:hypothetical protein
LEATQTELHLPTEAVIQHLRTAMETAINRAPDADFEWIRRHFIHHDGSSYFVIPNLYSVHDDKKEELRALAMNQLAGVFDDLKLVRALSEKELRRFGSEEQRQSYSDLNAYRRKDDSAVAAPAENPGWLKKTFGGSTPPPQDASAETSSDDAPRRLRNHSLLSKAERALDIAGWSTAAKSDVEVFRLVDTEGLTPLLIVLNRASLARGEGNRALDDGDPRDGGALKDPMKALPNYGSSSGDST